jgi:predicted transcriptional regulator
LNVRSLLETVAYAEKYQTYSSIVQFDAILNFIKKVFFSIFEINEYKSKIRIEKIVRIMDHTSFGCQLVFRGLIESSYAIKPT